MSAVEEVDYVEETGPGIPELPKVDGLPARPGIAGDVLEPEYPGWSQEAVETFLKGAGSGIHMLIGQGERDWLMTEKDLERIAPPLTRICNRWEPALKLSPYADPILVAHGMALYGWRSALERQRAIRDRQAGRIGRGPGYQHEGDEEPYEEPVADEELAEAGEEGPRPAAAPASSSSTLFPDAPIHRRRRTQ